MQLDSLVRVIKNLEFFQLRELTLRYLPMIGYSEPVLTDGWNDGGVDTRILQTRGLNPPTVVQMSVQSKAWAAKVRADVDKARKLYDNPTFLYVTTIRVPESDWAPIATEYRKKGVTLVKADCQALASVFFGHNATGEVLDIAGIKQAKAPTPSSLPSAGEQAAYAYLFMSEDASALRRSVLENAVLFAVLDCEVPIKRADLPEGLGSALGLRANQFDLVDSMIDSLLTRGHLESDRGRLSVAGSRVDGLISTRRLRQAELADLGDALQREVDRKLPRARRGRPGPEALLAAVGPILLDSSKVVSTSLRHLEANTELPSLRDRLQKLYSLLEESGIVDSAVRDELISRLVSTVSAKPIMKAVFASEVFRSMIALDANHLAAALGGGQFPVIVLDASVAMPTLLSLIHRPVDDRMFVGAYRLYAQVSSHSYPLELPDDYLEECAAHLINAYENYRELVEDVDALATSKNAYVAHFVRLRMSGDESTFSDYLGDLGISESILRTGDFQVRLRLVTRLLTKAFAQYAIEIVEVGMVKNEYYKDAVAELQDPERLGPARPAITTKHDARVMAWLDELPVESARVLCTWDRRFLNQLDPSRHTWIVVDPPVLSDLLALAAGGEDLPLTSPLTLIEMLNADSEDSAAAVWDWLATNTKDSFSDAHLRREAKKFVATYVDSHSLIDPSELEIAWTAWRHGSLEQDQPSQHNRA